MLAHAAVGLSLGTVVVHALMTQDSLDFSRLSAASGANQNTESAIMRQMALSINVWLEEESSQDNFFVTLFRRYFTKENGTDAEFQALNGTADTVIGELSSAPGVGNESSVAVDHPNPQQLTKAPLPRKSTANGISKTHKSWIPLVDAPAMRTAAETLGSQVPLTDEGYSTILEQGRKYDMEAFAQRLLKKKGLRLVDEDTFHEVLRYYNGECATQSFQYLQAELKRGCQRSKCRSPWLQRAKNLTNPARHVRFLSEVDLSGKLGVGASVKLNQAGYQQVAKAGHNGEMADFIKRLLDLMDLEIVSDWGLRNFVPYHSGECATQNFVRLVSELRRAEELPVICGGGWVKTKATSGAFRRF